VKENGRSINAPADAYVAAVALESVKDGFGSIAWWQNDEGKSCKMVHSGPCY
jgi:hypothetical protein